VGLALGKEVITIFFHWLTYLLIVVVSIDRAAHCINVYIDKLRQSNRGCYKFSLSCFLGTRQIHQTLTSGAHPLPHPFDDDDAVAGFTTRQPANFPATLYFIRP
jgi:hypothetical protein